MTNAREQFKAAYSQLRKEGFGGESMPMDQEAYNCLSARNRFESLFFTRRSGQVIERQISKRSGFTALFC